MPTIYHRMHNETPGPMRAHALNVGPRVIIMFSRGEGFEASLTGLKIFAYYSSIPKIMLASIMCQGLVVEVLVDINSIH